MAKAKRPGPKPSGVERKKFGIYLRPRIHDRAASIAKRTGVSFSIYVEQLIELDLAVKARKTRRS